MLQSPPFPGVSRDTAAVAIAAPGENIARSPRQRAELIALVREARVGGPFWGARPEPATGISAWRVLRSGGSAIRWLRRPASSRRRTLIVGSRRLRPFAAALRHAGAQVVLGPVDPWHLFDRLGACEDAGPELAWLAGAAGLTAARPEVLADALLRDVRYRDPFSGEPCSPEAAVALLAAWRATIDCNRALGGALGIAGWKKRAIGTMLWPGERELSFYRTSGRAVASAARQGRALAIWPTKAPPDAAATAGAAAVPAFMVEDGFLRSRGLGSDCVPPLSIVIDDLRPYYDPSGPSRLEQLIGAAPPDPGLEARAGRLVTGLIADGVGKYDTGRGRTRERPAAARVVLVAGQVEDDASWRLGGGKVTTNAELLARARAEEPGAWLIFRPHPDVEAGHRAGALPSAEALRHANEVDRTTPLAAMLDMVDAVHVLTSLTGFEALLRGREVVVHGQPFYAGWGVTRDLGPPIPRRARRATTLQIAAAALIRYPRYLDPVTGLPCSPETLVDRLVAGAVQPPSLLTHLRRLRRHVPLLQSS